MLSDLKLVMSLCYESDYVSDYLSYLALQGNCSNNFYNKQSYNVDKLLPESYIPCEYC